MRIPETFLTASPESEIEWGGGDSMAIVPLQSFYGHHYCLKPGWNIQSDRFIIKATIVIAEQTTKLAVAIIGYNSVVMRVQSPLRCSEGLTNV